jgi:hypothetical protein
MRVKVPLALAIGFGFVGKAIAVPPPQYVLQPVSEKTADSQSSVSTVYVTVPVANTAKVSLVPTRTKISFSTIYVTSTKPASIKTQTVFLSVPYSATTSTRYTTSEEVETVVEPTTTRTSTKYNTIYLTKQFTETRKLVSSSPVIHHDHTSIQGPENSNPNSSPSYTDPEATGPEHIVITYGTQTVTVTAISSVMPIKTSVIVVPVESTVVLIRTFTVIPLPIAPMMTRDTAEGTATVHSTIVAIVTQTTTISGTASTYPSSAGPSGWNYTTTAATLISHATTGLAANYFKSGSPINSSSLTLVSGMYGFPVSSPPLSTTTNIHPYSPSLVLVIANSTVSSSTSSHYNVLPKTPVSYAFVYPSFTASSSFTASVSSHGLASSSQTPSPTSNFDNNSLPELVISSGSSSSLISSSHFLSFTTLNRTFVAERYSPVSSAILPTSILSKYSGSKKSTVTSSSGLSSGSSNSGILTVSFKKPETVTSTQLPRSTGLDPFTSESSLIPTSTTLTASFYMSTSSSRSSSTSPACGQQGDFVLNVSLSSDLRE